MKKMVGIFVCMLLISTIIPVSGTNFIENTFVPASLEGNTLYVGGSGPNNYTSIQDAIDDAEDGFTIYVYNDSSPYYEHILIDKSLTLIGEDRETTIIDGNKTGGHVVNITAKGVDFSGFTVQNSGHFAGMMVSSSKNSIHHCKIMYNKRGIQLQPGLSNDFPLSRGNTIAYNILENNKGWGLIVYGNRGCTIVGNKVISNGADGIEIVGGIFGKIEGNIFINNDNFGLVIDSNFIKIANNEFRTNKIGGMMAWQANFNTITQNNFINNGETKYRHATYFWSYWQYWNKNYWNPREDYPSNSSKPYFIYRLEKVYTPVLFNVDWHPAKEPYEI